MDINDRIKNIGEYFAIFNVHENAVCVGVKFPDKWTLFDVDTICEEFHIVIQKKDDAIFFLCDIADGFDPVFDAVDFIIAQNKALEEKTTLLKAKVEQLRTLFEQEPLERLQTLRFVLDEENDTSKISEVTLPIDIKKELKNTTKKTTAKETVNETKKTEQVKQAKTRKKNNNDSSLMNFVKDALENE